MGIPRRDFGFVKAGGAGGKVWDRNVRKGLSHLIGDRANCCGLIFVVLLNSPLRRLPSS